MNKEFLDKYGNPDADGDGALDQKWFYANIKMFRLPFPMYKSWGDFGAIKTFQAHKLAGDKIIAAFTKMLALASMRAEDDSKKNMVSTEEAKPDALAWLRAQKYDIWGGCFEWRKVRGGAEWSKHGFGVAVDICPDIGQLGNVEERDSYPRFIVDAFKSEGFSWGGDFIGRVDPMHFELS